MSGVELIVGTVLGSVPIAIETYDRSKRVFDVFSTFKQYPREVRTLEAKIGAQRTIFRNNAINLLTAITKDRSKVRDVMNHSQSQAMRSTLTMATVYHNRLDALNDSFTACCQTSEQMQHTLQRLCAQLEDFVAQVGGSQEDSSASEWFRNVRTRFKLGLNKPQLGEAVEELRGFNRDFGSIATQITKALHEILSDQRDEPVATKRTVGSLNVLQRYHRIRYASKALYSTLKVQWVCSSHNRHSFDMRIIERGSVKGKETTALDRHVICELAVTADASKNALRLEVEHSCESDDETGGSQLPDKDNPTLQQLTAVLEANVGKLKLANSRHKKAFKNIKQEHQEQYDSGCGSDLAPQLPVLTHSVASLEIDSSILATLSTGSEPPEDLSLSDDFCKICHVATATCKNRSLLTCLKTPRTQWFVPSTSRTKRNTTQSLSELIKWISQEPVLRSLPRPLLVELAGNVAEGIMQFYSTPWLAHANLGQNVRYLNQTESSLRPEVQLEGPFFMTRLENTQAKHQPYTSSSKVQLEDANQYRSSTVPAFSEARNQLLFSFGILLLEIGYSRPWHELKESVSRTSSLHGEKLSDYRAAERLAQLLVNQMGLTYPKIIKKCLGCDFGLGETDLENEDLQRRFLDEVVLGLRRLRDHMRDVSFGPLG
ncbi:hypothetical protein NW762_007663 [Fusarium torreyae]|uniref:DUF7580 domain-containing protein n=1 Tax=Fusarium torreyae TaxID=1237075 RepID=A0A9W8S188_9HYPO|nr:hypothetical protein NW762_007663 [Fusarium torreyae]